MKKISVMLSAFILLISANTSFCEEIVTVSILDIHPTQPAAGVASVESIRKAKYSKINDIAEYRAKILAETPLKTVRGPEGDIYLTDGHHRALSIFRTTYEKCETLKPVEGLDACVKKADIKVTIEEDYSNESWDDFVDELHSSNKIYLTQSTWDKIKRGEISKKQVFKNPGAVLPQNLGKLGNDTMRSALGSLFSRQKFNIDSNNFVNYLEFFIAEKISNKVKIEPGHEFDSDVQVNLARAIFYTPDVLNYMRCLAKDDDYSWDKAQTDINLALRIEANTPFDRSICDKTTL